MLRRDLATLPYRLLEHEEDHKLSTTLPVSIIIPVYNGGEKFQQCLEAVGALSPAPHEVIVVADGDTDGSRERAERHRRVQVIALDRPHGPDYARNVGAAQATGKVLYFVDADVMVYPDALQKISETLTAHPGVSAMIGSYDDTPTEPNFASQYKNLTHHYVHQHSAEEASTFWGACGAIRREAFEAIGGFRMGYRAIEDIELGYRLRASGRRILLRKDWQVKHLKRWTIVSVFTTDFFGRALPWTKLIRREGHLLDDLNLDVTSRLSAAIAGLLVLAIALLWIPRVWVVAVLCGGTLLYLNRDMYRFLVRERGYWFGVRAVLWHWFYLLYSTAAYVIGTIQYWFEPTTNDSQQAP